MPYCSGCGNQLLEGARFCASCGAPTSATTTGAVQQRESTNAETIFYEDSSGALVSTSRAVLAGVTYPIGSISSVRMGAVAVSCWGPLLTIWGALQVLITGGIVLAGTTDALGGAAIGAVFLAIGIAILKRKRTLAIVLATTGGEAVALRSTNREAIESIVVALNKAIVARG